MICPRCGEMGMRCQLHESAPLLLEACKKAIFILENMNIQPFDLKTLKEIEAAVAKAQGNS